MIGFPSLSQPLGAAPIYLFLASPFISVCLGNPLFNKLVDRGFIPQALATLVFNMRLVSLCMAQLWIPTWRLCIFPWSAANRCSSLFDTSSSGPEIAEDKGARRYANVFAALALAYAVSAALATVIAIPAWAGAVRRKMHGGALFDWPAEKDAKDEEYDMAERAQQMEARAPEAIWEGGENATSGVDGGQFTRRGGGDNDVGGKDSEMLLPKSDYHENACTDSNTTPEHSGSKLDTRLLAVPFAHPAVVTYVLADQVLRSRLAWYVRWPVAIMTLLPIVWELPCIWWAAFEFKLRRNHREVVQAAAMGATACVRLLLLLWLFGTALLTGP